MMERKLTVTYGKYVYPEAYKRINFEVTQDFDGAETTREDAAKQLMDFVNKALKEQVAEYLEKNGKAANSLSDPELRRLQIEAEAEL